MSSIEVAFVLALALLLIGRVPSLIRGCFLAAFLAIVAPLAILAGIVVLLVVKG